MEDDIAVAIAAVAKAADVAFGWAVCTQRRNYSEGQFEGGVERKGGAQVLQQVTRPLLSVAAAHMGVARSSSSTTS